MRRLIAGIMLCLVILQTGCSNDIEVVKGKANYISNGVSIEDKGNYFAVTLDFTKNLSHRQIGEEFAKGILEMVPDYEALVDSYIAENLSRGEYKEAFWRVEDIKPQLDKNYRDEIEGMASVFSGGDNTQRADKKLSRDEFYLFNVFLDVIRNTQCSFVSVYGERSVTHKTLTGRNLDWYAGNQNQLPRIQAVITIKNPKGNICSIGYMGFLGIITGFNDSKVFTAVQESQTGGVYSSIGKRSYPLDLRYALENSTKMDSIIDFMMDTKKNYAANHLIVFSDPNESKVLENNISGSGTTEERVKRAVRTSDSKLNKKVSWGIKDAIACVNSFILYGNYDNHSTNGYNTRRWKYIKDELNKIKNPLTMEDIKRIMTYCNGSPSAFNDTKYAFTKSTLYIVLFEPDTLSMELYFYPRNTLKSPDKPTFEKLRVF